MPSPVVLLHDAHASQGRVDASDVLVEAEHIARALPALGYTAQILPVGLDLAELERTLESARRRARSSISSSRSKAAASSSTSFRRCSRLTGLPFTGCSAGAHCLTSNKLAAKRHMRRCRDPDSGDVKWRTVRSGVRGS